MGRRGSYLERADRLRARAAHLLSADEPQPATPPKCDLCGSILDEGETGKDCCPSESADEQPATPSDAEVCGFCEESPCKCDDDTCERSDCECQVDEQPATPEGELERMIAEEGLDSSNPFAGMAALERRAKRDAQPPTPHTAKVRVVKCPCGDSVCQTYGLSDGMFYQGCGWDKTIAEHHAQAINSFDALVRALDKLITAAEIVDGQEAPPDSDDVEYLHSAISESRAALRLAGK